MKYILGTTLVVIVTSFLILFQDKNPNIQKISIAGSSTVAPLLSEIARLYEREHPDVRIEIQTGGSSRGITDTRESRIHIGMVSRSPYSNETDIKWYPIAKDGIGIITHAKNTLKSINKSQLTDIYLGTIKSWKQLSGQSDGEIIVVHKAEGRSTQEVFLNFLGKDNKLIKPSIIIGDNQQGIKTVAGNEFAIGYVSIGAAEVAISEGIPIKILMVNGKEASTIAIQEDRYDIARTLHIVSKSSISPHISEFINFATSVQTQDLIKRQYFVPMEL